MGFGSFRSGKKGERKGGGLQILMPKSDKFNFTKIKNNNKEILEIEGTLYGIGLKLVIVYFDVRKDEEGKKVNKKIRKDMEKIIENNNKEGLILAGDFNGHLRMIDGRDNDDNGKMLMEWVEKYEVILLNLDERCEGKYTRIQKDQKTTVDYILVNKKIFDKIESIKIDENKETLEGSDHVAMSIKIKVKKENNGFKKSKWKVKEYYSDKDEDINKLVDYIENKWSQLKPRNYQAVIDDIQDASDKIG